MVPARCYYMYFSSCLYQESLKSDCRGIQDSGQLRNMVHTELCILLWRFEAVAAEHQHNLPVPLDVLV
jgi:hypothetical protein